MSIGEIFRTALIDTALGMGTVFMILIFISVCIWIMGVLCREKEPAVSAGTDQPPMPAEPSEGIPPELVAVITAAVHQYMKDEHGDSDDSDYIVRNVRRSTWRHTS